MKIGLLGCGVVGKEVRTILDKKEELELVRILVKEESEIDDTRMTLSYEKILQDEDINLIIECMGGLEPAYTYVKEALKHHKHVVTSNKKMLATHFMDLYEIACKNQVSLRYEACVAGGIPWIHEMNRVQRIDKIHSFYGIMNGTTNYILTKVAEGLSFEEALSQAQQNGFAEQDPTDDIDGYDARYKGVLTALTSFQTYIPIEEVPVYGIRSLSFEDQTYALNHDGIIKLLVQGVQEENEISLSVIPTLVSKDYILAKITNETNAVFVTSDTLKESGYIGKGAGGEPTAHAVVQDVLSSPTIFQKDIQEGRNHLSRTASFYLRFSTIDHNCPFVKKVLSETTILTKPITLKELYEYTKVNDIAFVMEVTQ